MTSANQSGLTQFLTYRIHVLNKLSERGISELYQRKIGISIAEARVIAAVGAFGPFSVMELARHANLDKSQASRAAEALMRRALLQRQASRDDGRIVVVSLTPAGRALYRKIMPIARRWNDDMFAVLGEREHAQLSRLLDKVIAAARNLEVLTAQKTTKPRAKRASASTR
ncbi:MarR family winged helix-turn-helix transcriptional regulator [Mycetohabitans sp. B5]|uniref:MarR family transcriptional regulator n=1 Tax=Mycetohabitans endofungorum TaxID=417203 RepID=A0A2P5KA66_9BURK|nr:MULTISPECIES: MarR family winged helix-turn-helix transcriptional regulator [Mycetohabitans]MCG1054724.1 MarR family winged helix-turn-helix transcriptional regulator [Mycetohabitans sp. B5]PPB83525.1 MarR family transcriptional regulator [Mycetohabitans endofungorum]